MSKELEALERLYCAGNLNLDYVCSNKHKEDYNTIETALKRLKEIDEWKTSYQIPNDEELRRYIHNGWVYENKGEKQIKALEIIKKKKVDLEFLFEDWEEENWEFALENYNMNHEIELTQEEYDLLKEVLL